MKRIVFIFCSISAMSFAGTPENRPLEKSPVELEGVESSISESWNVAFSEEFEAEASGQSTTYSLTGPGNSVFCLFDDGEYWIGSTDNPNVMVQLLVNCSQSGGESFIGPKMQ